MERRDEQPARGPAAGRATASERDQMRDPEGKAPQLEGGVVGAGAGAAMGMVAGPVGMVVGALAGAVGGWWAIDKITEGQGTYVDDDDRWCRDHYEHPGHRLADRAFEDVRPAYVYGHMAAGNPDLAGRRFADVEGELERDWNAGLAARHGEWARARPYARAAYERRVSR